MFAEIRCPPLPSWYNLILPPDWDNHVGAHVNVTCPPDHELMYATGEVILAEDKSVSLLCQLDGYWKPAVPVCQGTGVNWNYE